MPILIAKLFTIILLIIGIFIIFKIDILKGEKIKSISFTKATAKAKRVRINATTTLSKYEKLAIRIDALLKKLGKSRKYLYSVVIICFVVGCMMGFLCFQGTFLSLMTGITFIPLTYLYLIFRTQEATREELAELQNTMSIITNAYLSNNNILKSVELYIAERNRYTDERLRKTTPFEEFVSDSLYINPNLERGLDRLAAKISNRYFDQWVKNLRLCINNKEMRFSLQPVIDAMADEKIMQIESDTQMAKTWRNYLSTVAVMFAVIFILRIAREEWYLILTQTTIGQGIIVLMLISALVSSIFVMKINKPIGNI